MSTIPNDFHARFTACLARSDAAEAQRLIAIVKAAQASGNATGAGWSADLAKLTAVAGGRAVIGNFEGDFAKLLEKVEKAVDPTRRRKQDLRDVKDQLHDFVQGKKASLDREYEQLRKNQKPIDMPLPPPLAARVEVTLAKLALAETPREVEIAKAEGLQLKADIENHVMFRAATTPASAKSIFDGMTGR